MLTSQQLQERRLWVIGGVFVGVVMLVLAMFLGNFIGARVLGLAGPRTWVQQGEHFNVVLKQSQLDKKIELCYTEPAGQGCIALRPVVSRYLGLVEVVIPSNAPLGKGFIGVRRRFDTGLGVVSWFDDRRAVLIVPATSGGVGGDGAGSVNQDINASEESVDDVVASPLPTLDPEPSPSPYLPPTLPPPPSPSPSSSFLPSPSPVLPVPTPS